MPRRTRKPSWQTSVDRIFSDLSNDEIKKALERMIINNFPHNVFLAAPNRYIVDTVNRINIDFKKRPLLSKRRDVSEYIAASSINHCSDSWNYLSRSIASVINGDYTSSIHLAYYSELRSVMSIMANEGVGVFNSKHIWFKKDNKCDNFGGRTHDVANYIINKWAEQADKRDLIFGLLKINNKTIAEWIAAAGLSNKSKLAKQVLKEWLQEWSIDLNIKKDQNIRNEVSYRPKIFYQNFNPLDTIQSVKKIWSACEPSNNEKFRNLDIHLLRIILSTVYKFKTKGGNLNGDIDSKNFISGIMQNLGLTSSEALINFLSKANNPDNHYIMDKAKESVFSPATMTYDPFPIICRAFLLLRIATATTESLISQSSISATRKDSLKFWWSKICFNSGISENADEITDFNDLYTDIEDSFNEIDFTTAAYWGSSKNAFDKYSLQITKIKQFHRVGLWGLAL